MDVVLKKKMTSGQKEAWVLDDDDFVLVSRY